MIDAIITFYCACVLCCGPWSEGWYHKRTASGRMAQAGLTAACPPGWEDNVIWIDGIGARVCDDTGSAIRGNKFDVYVNDHQEALNHGIKRTSVLIVQEPILFLPWMRPGLLARMTDEANNLR